MEGTVIGQRATFTIMKGQTSFGRIIDKISMLNKLPKEDDTNRIQQGNHDSVTVTGYLIEDKDGRLHSIQYWRIQKIEKFEEKPLTDEEHRGLVRGDFKNCEEEDAPKRDLKGGYKRRG